MPDTHITKNFFAHGGDELVIGGKLTLLEGATIEGLTGAIEKIENVPESTATTVAALKESFNALLAFLKAAGFMEADPEEDPEEDDGDDDGDNNGDNGGSSENGGSGGDNSGSGENGGSGSGGENPGGGAAG